MHRLTTVIFLLVVALLIQNTCPFGAAGKSTVAAACAHCSIKHGVVASSEGQKSISPDSSQVHFPMFVFAVSKPIHAFQLIPVQSARPVLADQYQDALPDELLRPPRA
jgi:hypothetical protein